MSHVSSVTVIENKKREPNNILVQQGNGGLDSKQVSASIYGVYVKKGDHHYESVGGPVNTRGVLSWCHDTKQWHIDIKHIRHGKTTRVATWEGDTNPFDVGDALWFQRHPRVVIDIDVKPLAGKFRDFKNRF